jgi:hypothetical protein
LRWCGAYVSGEIGRHYVAWIAGSDSDNPVMAVSGSDALAVEGRYIVMAANDRETSNGRILEDGFCVLLTATDWAKIRHALEEGSSISVPLDGEAGGIRELAVECARRPEPP